MKYIYQFISNPQIILDIDKKYIEESISLLKQKKNKKKFPKWLPIKGTLMQI